jgi:lipid II:glycine glycyltransferase (peptidoglycan interpeptide bridge formation enzyme)
MNNVETYRRLCRTAADLPLFSQDWHLDAVSGDGEWNVALVRRDGRVIASLPYCIKRKWGFRYIYMPHFTKTMGPYIAPEYRGTSGERRIMEELIGQLPEVDGFKQDFHYSISNWLPFHWRGYRQTTRYTYLLDVGDLNGVFDGINRNMRRNIQKAERQLTVTYEGSLEDFYRINRMSFERQGIPIPYSFEMLRRHDEALAAHNARQIFFAIDDRQRIHSAAYLVWDRRSSYYHLAGDDPELRHSGAGIFLIWKAIQYTNEQLGLPTFDFEGSMIRNIEHIRSQFGARQQPYHRVWKYHSRLYRVLDTFQQWRKGE